MKHKIISIVAGLAMLLNCSCSEDFLETKSTSSVDTDQMFINYKSAMMAVNFCCIVKTSDVSVTTSMNAIGK